MAAHIIYAPKRPCAACGNTGHPLRECPFRDYHETGGDKVSMTSSKPPAVQTLPISHAHLGLPGDPKRQVSRPRLPTTQNPPSYAYLCLKSRAKQQSHPLPSREFQKPGSSPLALSCVTATDGEDAIDATPISESTISPDGALDAEKSMHGEDVSDTTPIPELTTATDGTGNSQSA
ncbi:hypothetical protein N7501_003698 [Penicillium viridicatum]|nr:hypothetical protein N7501_003698 [Penicillium viridicatum]